MTQTSKITVGVAAILLVVFGVWWYAHTSTTSMMPATTQTGTVAESTTTSASTAASATGATPASDTSDAAMAQDAANIDGQMTGLNSDNANTDQGLNSQ